MVRGRYGAFPWSATDRTEERLASTAHQAQEEQEHVKEVQVEAQRADDSRLLHGPETSRELNPPGCAGRRTP